MVFAVNNPEKLPVYRAGDTMAILAVVLALSAIVFDLFTKSKEITTVSAVYFGLLLGFMIGTLIWMGVQPLVGQYLTIAGMAPEGGPDVRRIETILQFMITGL